jgi:hypothetical protein
VNFQKSKVSTDSAGAKGVVLSELCGMGDEIEFGGLEEL